MLETMITYKRCLLLQFCSDLVMRVCVLGGGVVGVTSALELLSTQPSTQLTLVAAEFCEETTSHGAAGIFRPGTSFSGPTPEVTR